MGADSQPTRVRYGVMAYLCALSFVLYIDRNCIAKAANFIQADLRITNTQWGLVLGSFTLSYALFEVVTGHWGDRFGSRRVLVRIVLWWSGFTALTGVVWWFEPMGLGEARMVEPPAFEQPVGSGQWHRHEAYAEPAIVLFSSLYLLMLVRFLFGAGEAGALPNSARIISRWFPAGRRGPPQALFNTMMLVGGAVAPVTSAYLIEAVGWRWTFAIFGCLGLLWAAPFAWWFRDDPAEHPGVNAAELEYIAGYAGSPPPRPSPIEGEGEGASPAPQSASAEGEGENAPRPSPVVGAAAHHPSVPWRRVLTTPSIWLLGAAMICAACYTYLLYSWYPKYLESARGLTNKESGWLSGAVLLAGTLGFFIGGHLVDGLSAWTGSRRWTLRALGASGMTLAGFCAAASIHFDNATVASMMLAIALFGIAIQVCAWWGAMTDVAGAHIGALFGLCNSLGGIGSFGSQTFFGWFSDHRMRLGFEGRAAYDPAFNLYAGVLFVGAICWFFIDSSRSAVEGPE